MELRIAVSKINNAFLAQNGGKAAIGPFDDLNRITALGQKGIIDF